MFTKDDKLLLAISGGADSVTLAHFLKHTGFTFSLAHCNFKLRGKDSNKDEAFCRKLAEELKVEIFVKAFDTKKYAKQNGASTQMAARNLRYRWFNELINTHQFDYLVTAHHANDVVETVFINLLRGTGIKGLRGIPKKNGKIVRPLLPFTKEDIEAYTKTKKLKFRLDKSNLEDKYERNFLRLKVIPKLKKINPNIEKTFSENVFRFEQEADIVQEYLSTRLKALLNDGVHFASIDKAKLRQEKYKESLLHYILGSLGFNATQQQNVLENITSNSLSGKKFYTEFFVLTIDRKALIIEYKQKHQAKFNSQFILSLADLKKQTLCSVSTLKAFQIPKKNELIVCTDKLIFPLEIRTKKTGDKFKPFGMKGFKLLSDFFKDEKLNAFEKENVKLLVNGNGEIIWVINHRSDERYRVNKEDKHLLKLTFSD